MRVDADTKRTMCPRCCDQAVSECQTLTFHAASDFHDLQIAPRMICLAAFGDVFGAVVGVILGLAGLATSFMCLMAISEGVVKRGTAGLAAGLVLLGVGLWLAGVL